MDLHAGQVQGFFHVPVDHMTAYPMLTHGAHDQNRRVGDRLQSGRAKTAQPRPPDRYPLGRDRGGAPAQQVAEIGYVVGDVKRKTAVRSTT
jgi:ribose-phosphate pyrophosphokinase